MCGSFTQPGDIRIIEGFRARYGVEVSNDPGEAGQPIGQEQKATPFRDVNVVYSGRDGTARVAAMYWQLIHHWNQEFRSKYTAFKTRVESLGKRHNEPLLCRRRCIFPVSEFYETRKIGGRPVQPRESYGFSLKDGGLMALGGIYSVWHNPEDEDDRRFSCSIITLEPTDIIAEVHNRMPFILRDSDVKIWMDPEVTEFDNLMDLILPISSEDLIRSKPPV